MNYPSKRAYYENENNNNAKEPCYTIGHKDAIYTKDDESETLGIKLDSIDAEIGTETLGTTAQTLKGAVNEVKAIADSNTTQLSDLANNKVDKSKIANNLITNQEGYILDARQAQAITDIINSLTDTGVFSVSLTAETPLEYTINFSKTLRNIPNLNLVLISNSISTYQYYYSIKDITPTYAIISIRCNVILPTAVFKYSATCM